MLLKSLFGVLLIFSILSGQSISSVARLDFDSTRTGFSNTKSFTVLNKSPRAFSGTLKVLSGSAFTAGNSNINIAANGSVVISLTFKPSTNILYQSAAIIMNQDSTSALAVALRGAGYFGDSYDASTYNKFDANLKSALTSLVTGQTALGYNTARDRMFETIDDYGGDTIECVYTGIKIYATTRTIAQNLGFNTEHTWPQSTFNSADPMVSDLNHLYPTESNVNNVRSNYPFGLVVSGVTYSQGGSRLGRNVYNQIVFEPRDIHKGNVARSMLYFILRYTNNYGTYLDTVQENVYRLWNKNDTVESRERRRNGLVAQYQGKRNPLIDHPEFVDRIYSFLTVSSRPMITSATVFPKRLNFDTTKAGEISTMNLFLVNSGTNTIRLDSVSMGEGVGGSYTRTILQPGESEKILLAFAPQTAGSYQGVVKVYAGLQSFNVPFTGVAVTATGVDKRTAPLTEADLNIFPNPFAASATVRYSVPARGIAAIKVYDILGTGLYTIAEGEKEAGEHEAAFSANNIAGGKLPNGVYLIEYSFAGSRIFRKMVLLR